MPHHADGGGQTKLAAKMVSSAQAASASSDGPDRGNQATVSGSNSARSKKLVLKIPRKKEDIPLASGRRALEPLAPTANLPEVSARDLKSPIGIRESQEQSLPSGRRALEPLAPTANLADVFARDGRSPIESRDAQDDGPTREVPSRCESRAREVPIRCESRAAEAVGQGSAAAWAADAIKAGAETSTEVEALCCELAARRAKLESELAERRREAGRAAEENVVIERNIAAIDEKIELARLARVEASQKLQGLTQKSAHEVKAMKNRPPRTVQRGLEAVYTILHCRRWLHGAGEGLRGLDMAKEWPRIQRMLSNNGFVPEVLQFDVASLDCVPHVAEYVAEKYFPGLAQQATCVDCPSPSSPSSPRSPKPYSSEGQEPLEAGTGERRSLPPVGAEHARRRSAASTGRLGGKAATDKGLLRTAPIAGSAPSAAAADARLNSTSRPRKGSTNGGATEAVSEALDIAAVEYASRPCGALVHWLSEVLREFFALRELRLRREALRRQLDEGARRREEAIAQLLAEIKLLSDELQRWQARLVELRSREAEAERALAGLATLSCLEERYSLAAGGLGKLRPVGRLKPLPEPSPETLGKSPQDETSKLPVGRVGPLLRSARTMPEELAALEHAKPTEVKRQPKPQTIPTDNSWPPRGRKYLHVMSSPSLPPAEEAA